MLSFLLAAGATAAVFLYLHGVKEDKTSVAPVSTVQVIVSKQDIPAGTELDGLITGGSFTTLEIPTSAVVQGAATDLSQLQGRTTNSLILQGEQISVARLEGSEQSASINRLGIPAGYQAMTVSLEAQRIIAGIVQQGDHVAVYATVADPKTNVQETATVVPDAQVLRLVGPTPENPGAEIIVTLALTPEDVAKVVLAQEQGHVWLSLLPPGERGAPQAPVSVTDLIK
jgi:pilus assembly protein CpaB